MFGSVLLCFSKSVRKKKKLPALTHPLKLGSKKSTCSTLCISSYQTLTTTWKQINITQVLPVSIPIVAFQNNTNVSIHFIMMGLTHQRFNCIWQDNAEMSQWNNLSCRQELPKVWQSTTAYNSSYRFLSQVKLMLSIQYDSIQVSRLLQWLLLIWHILGSFIMQHPTWCKNPEGNKHDF